MGKCSVFGCYRTHFSNNDFVAVRSKKYKYSVFKWALIAFASYVGYKIKPQIFIVFLAIILHALLTHRISVKRFWKPVTSAVIGLIAALLLTDAAISTIPVRIDNSRTFGMPHFLMMGMNYESQGVWNAVRMSTFPVT